MLVDPNVLIDSAVKVVTAELDMRRYLGPDREPDFKGVRVETLEKAWEFLGKAFDAGMKE